MVETLNSNLQNGTLQTNDLHHSGSTHSVLLFASLVCSPFYAGDWHASPLQNTQKKQSNIGEVKINVINVVLYYCKSN